MNNKKTHPPVFQPFIFLTYLRNHLSYRKILYIFSYLCPKSFFHGYKVEFTYKEDFNSKIFTQPLQFWLDVFAVFWRIIFSSATNQKFFLDIVCPFTRIFNCTKKSSLIWRGGLLIFDLKSCLYVNFIPWYDICGKSFWIFQNGGLFLRPNFLLANLLFFKYQLILLPDLKNSCSSWKPFRKGYKKMLIDFLLLKQFRRYTGKTEGWKTRGMCFFVIDCINKCYTLGNPSH